MFRSQIKLLIVFLLSSFLISFNANAHHKKNLGYLEISWDQENVEKKDAEENARETYCSVNAKGKSLKIKSTNEAGEPFEEIKNIVEIKGYHTTKARKIKKGILPLRPKKLDLNIYEETTLLEVLKLYCVQLKSKDRPDVVKFKTTYLDDFYKEIAAENKFFNDKDEVDYNLPIVGGRLNEGILDKGISISNKDAVYYVPDYLIETVKKNEKAEGARIANKDWINKNKPSFVLKIKEKKQLFDNKIKALKKSRNGLDPLLKDYKKELEEAKIRVEDTLDLVDIRNKEIKILVKEFKSNKRKYLVDTNLKEFTKNLNTLKKINFEKYKSYQILNALLRKVEKSEKKKNFVGYKKLGGKKVIGYLAEFEDIEDQKLGSKIDEANIESLKKDIIKEINNIQEYITGPLDKIVNLDEELSDNIPILLYSIFAGIFLIVIAVIVYIYLQSRRISSLRRETDTAGKKFSDIEGKLRDTSEKIKTAGRQGRGRSTADTTTPEPVKEKPKTSEQIIAGKFHDMVSDYNEAIDNFSNVAAFKQKWNGVALTRRPRQDGTKTVLINSSRAFEKSEIWCVNFSDKYFAFPGSSVKSNMAAYMNLDFEKASRDFKGVFDISAGSSWETEPSIVRRGGAGFVVERKGKLIFPS